MSRPRTRVLIVDDSEIFVEVLKATLEDDPTIEVVGVAYDGLAAVERTRALQPDAITMDVSMPAMDGLAAVESIMADVPTPILVVTADPRGPTGELSFDALRLGAIDVVGKPERWPLAPAAARAFQSHVKMIAGISVVPHLSGRRPRWKNEPGPPVIPSTPRPRPDAIGIVSSTGGSAVIARILTALRRPYPPAILVVQHLAPGFDDGLRGWLDRICELEVALARDGEPLPRGRVTLAPSGHHLTLEGRKLRFHACPANESFCPSGDRLFSSMAADLGSRGLGIVLSGMGRDGARGLLQMRRAGARTASQDREECAVFGMPKAAEDLGASEQVLGVDELVTLVAGFTEAPR